MSIDWSKAPHDAEAGYLGTSEHYSAWYRRDGIGQVQQICPSAGFNEWTWMGGREDFPIGAELRPAPKLEWNGEGLPHAGTVCEIKGCMSHYLQWNKVTVFAVRGKTVFFDMEDGRWGQTDSHEIRPLRTPEQIAAEEREAQAKNLFEAVYSNPMSAKWCQVSDERRQEFLALIDAGWSKKEAP